MIAEFLYGAPDVVPVWVARLLYVVVLLAALIVPIAIIVRAAMSALGLVQGVWRK